MPAVLAALPATAAGLMALVLLFGVILLVDLILKSIDVAAIPGLVGDMFRLIAHGIAVAAQWIGTILANIARVGLSIFLAPAGGFINVIDQVVWAIGRFGNWIRWLVHTAVPQLWNGLFATVAQAISHLTSFATQLYQQALAYVGLVESRLARLIQAATAAVSAYAFALHRLLATALTAGLANAIGYAQSLFRAVSAALVSGFANMNQLMMAIRAQLANYSYQLAQWAVATATGVSIDWAKKYADQLIDLYNKAIGAAGALAMAPAWPTVLNAIDSISLALPDSIAATLARIGAIPKAIPRDIAAEVGAVAAVSTIALDWVARCGVSLCRNTKRFGDDLAALEDAALIAAIFELVAEGIRNPDGAAKAFHDDVVSPLLAIEREFANLVGLGG